MENKQVLTEKKERHHSWEIWRTARGNYRSMGPGPKYDQRSFKTYKDALEWLQNFRDRERDLYDLRMKGITPKTELKKVITYIRGELTSEIPVNYETSIRKVLDAISKIHAMLA